MNDEKTGKCFQQVKPSTKYVFIGDMALVHTF